MKVLVAGPLEPFLRHAHIPADIEVELLPEAEELPRGDYEGIVPMLTRRLGAAELERLPRLRVIANFAVGYDNVDVAAARARGVAVTNTPGVLTEATAELTWALILSAARRLPEGEALVRSGSWEGWGPTQLLGMGLTGKVLGLLGAGRIARAVARRAPAFGMRVAYWSRTRREAWERESGATFMQREELYAAADVLSLHLALTPETRALIGRAALERMKVGSVLVNTARGGLVDEDALADALESGRLRAAGLDVYAAEPAVP
ncbi:MAG TPA: NAD(P)-dependent oxidoreductase, partial [Longimicrobiales bacterium]